MENIFQKQVIKIVDIFEQEWKDLKLGSELSDDLKVLPRIWLPSQTWALSGCLAHDLSTFFIKSTSSKIFLGVYS